MLSRFKPLFMSCISECSNSLCKKGGDVWTLIKMSYGDGSTFLKILFIYFS